VCERERERERERDTNPNKRNTKIRSIHSTLIEIINVVDAIISVRHATAKTTDDTER
jgi:hypothetical protein